MDYFLSAEDSAASVALMWNCSVDKRSAGNVAAIRQVSLPRLQSPNIALGRRRG
jgi:hypothetical protein